MMKQLTDEEIVKALECCIDARHNPAFCELCPYFQDKDDCVIKSVKDTINLINRQRAELESLSKKLENYKHLDVILHTAIDKLTNSIKSEAYKEFAEKLKAKAYWDIYMCNYIPENCIDETLQEMESN